MKKFELLSVLALSAVMLAGCGAVEETNYNTSYEVTSEASYKGDDFVSVAKSTNMELLLQPSTGTIRWKNLKTGEYVDNRISSDELSDATALSDVVATYFNGTNSKKYNSTASMDSYTYGIEAETLTYEDMDNGVRFVYRLGSDDVTYKMFPAYISDERMQSMILDKLDTKQQKAVKAQYRQTASGTWARKTNKENPLSGLAAPQLYEIFYDVCGYTYEDLQADCEEWDTTDEFPDNQTVEIVMEYYLDGDDLMVRIPTENLISGSDYPMNCLEVLPYFMSSDSDDGYIFVPDGSGALIYLDNDKLTEYQYNSRYYGGDILEDMETYDPSPTYMTLPVYGIKADDHAVLGIIEKGAEVAELTTYLSGYYSGIDYARASLKFYIRESQTLSSYVGATNNYTLSKVSTDYYHDDILLRYCFLTGDDANYAGMAKAYQERLVAEDAIAQNETEEEAPLFVDLLGEVDKELYFLGIPYDGSIALTSFNDALGILQDLANEGISNLKVQYEGMVNGGLNQRAVENVKVSSKLGGKSDLKKLTDYADSIGAEIYPSLLLQTAVTDEDLSKNERSYTLAGEVAVVPEFDLVYNKVFAFGDKDLQTFIISPTYIYDYILKFKKSYDKLGIGNVASSDFMTFMSANYRNEHNVSITTGMENYEKALDTLSESYKLMLSNPISLAYEDVDYLTDIPTDNSGTKILDASVPFTQMVLDGCITYAGEYANRDNESLDETLMNAIESKSALNFRFMTADTSDLTDTTKDDVFFAEYRLWKDKVATCYNKYNEFYQMVKDATITNHEIVDRNNDYRVVTYSNGVKVYLNYSDEKASIEGTSVDALSYVIKEGGR